VAQEQTIVGGTVVTFDSLTAVQQEARASSCVKVDRNTFKSKADLQNYLTTGDDHCPKTRQQTLHLLDEHSKSTVTKPTNSEGAWLLAEGAGGGDKKKKETFDKACWKGKTCYKCNGKDHPASHCKSKKADEGEKNEEVFLTAETFFVNKILFFLSLSHEITFTAVNHLANRTVPNTFKAFKEMCQHCLH
jgi:hypothetical protein